jgi:hypothetical protein
MAEHKTIKDLGCEVIEDFLMAAGTCVETRKPDGGILGYPATLILLAVTDAIGHGLDVGSGETRLAVLQHPSSLLFWPLNLWLAVAAGGNSPVTSFLYLEVGGVRANCPQPHRRPHTWRI